MRVVVWTAVLVACGASSEPVARTGPAASTTATPAPDDVIVAQVNGRPIYGSCVAAQAVGKTKQVALDECIALELMAQEAEARGLATDPRVVDETRTALVNRLVEIDYEQKYKTPADMADVVNQQIDRNQHLLKREEGRASAYVRINLPQTPTPQQDWEARQHLEKLAARLANEEGLTTGHLEAIAKEVLGPIKYELAIVDLHIKKHLVPSYADAVFAIPEIGRTTPTAVRTYWGWDVILLTDIAPAIDMTREQAAAEAFPEIRRGYFLYWVDQIARSLGVKITKFDKAIAKLDEEPAQ